MDTYNWSEVVAAAVVPMVVISACGLLCLALYNRLAAVVARLRGFERERIEALVALARDREGDAPEEQLRHQKVLQSVEQQVAAVTRRAKLIQRALLFLLGAVCWLLLCSLGTALGKLLPGVRPVAVVFFILGLGSMLGGMLHAFAEMLQALNPLQLEDLAIDELAEELVSSASEAAD